MSRKRSLADMYSKLALFLYYIVRSFIYPLIPRKYLVKNVAGEVVLITGGGFGLGRLLAQRFAKLGSKVVIWDVNRDNMDKTKEMIECAGGECYAYYCDVSDAQCVNRTADQVRKEVGHVTILVMNAGIVNGRKLLDLSEQQIRKCFDVNALSHFWLTKAFLPFMMKINSGHVISIDVRTVVCCQKTLLSLVCATVACCRRQNRYDIHTHTHTPLILDAINDTNAINSNYFSSANLISLMRLTAAFSHQPNFVYICSQFPHSTGRTA